MVYSSLDQFKIASLISLEFIGIDLSVANFLLASLVTIFVFQSLVRYAYDFVIFVWGTKNGYLEIKKLVKNFLKGDLDLDFPEEKSCIIYLKKDKVNFLGFQIWQSPEKSDVNFYVKKDRVKINSSLPRVVVKTFFNNLITISSFLITPPKSLGKISMLSWFVNQYEESTFIIGCILAEVFMLGIALLGFLLIYIVCKKDTFFVKEVLPYFKKLSPMRKLILGSFTVFTAIPNKFWINVKIHFISVFIISATIYFLGLIFPFLFFCYIIYLILCFESLIFGLLYENSEYFRKFINYLLFGSSDEPFAANYLYWFWGNMWKQASRKVGPIVAGAAVVEAKRQYENKEKNEYADKHTEQASTNTKEGFKDPNEIAEYHKDRRDEWVQENGSVTKIMKTIEDWWNAS